MNLKNILTSKSQDVAAVIIITIFYFILSTVFDIGCPILWLTGISCAGCGMTRAWKSVLHLDFSSAFYYHPLFFLPVTIVLLYINKNKLTKRITFILSIIILLSFLIIYLLRLLDPSDSIVIFQPEEGILSKIFSSLLNKINFQSIREVNTNEMFKM